GHHRPRPVLLCELRHRDQTSRGRRHRGPGYRTGVATLAPTALQDRFGIIVNVFTFGLPSEQLFARVVEIAAAIESTSYDTLWLPDHVVQGPVGDIGDDVSPTTPIFDALTLLGALAVATERVRLGPLVSPITVRHPAVLAKSITTTDVVSGGRAVLG